MRLLLKSLIIGFVFSFHFAQAANSFDAYYTTSGVYQQLQAGLRDQPLKELLNRTLTSNHRALGYDGARAFMFTKYYPVNHNGVFTITDVYCQKDYVVPGPGPKIELPADTILNVEHTWPQSKFGGPYPKEFQKSDLHHLFPSDSHMNSDRGNYPFGEVSADVKHLICPVARFGHPANGADLVFEPPPQHRGNAARAMFYFSVRYKMPIDDAQEAILRKWNIEDPVDSSERDRNDAIFKVQQNRNPFVDMPELADRIRDF